MVRRGSTVRVRQRALQKSWKLEASCAHSTCYSSNLVGHGALSGTPRLLRRRRSSRNAPIWPLRTTRSIVRGRHASMLIALDCNLIDVQRRLGHRKPDTTLRVYAHEWKYREAQRSQAGRQIGRLIAGEGAKALARP